MFLYEPLTISHPLLIPLLSLSPIKAQEMMSSLQSPHDRQTERGGKSETARASNQQLLEQKRVERSGDKIQKQGIVILSNQDLK